MRVFSRTNKSVNRRTYQEGFTIVELLIVVVVIAVLASITIVAYNGISKQARQSAFLSELEQHAKRMELWKIQNGEIYPATYAAATSAGLLGSSDSLEFQTTSYTVSPDRKNYCVTGSPASSTSDSEKYSITSTSGAVAIEGVCVTNLVTSPAASDSSPWTAEYGTGGVATTSVGDLFDGVQYRGITWGSYSQHAPTDTNGLYIGCQGCVSVTSGTSYFVSYHYRVTWATSMQLLLADGSKLSLASMNQPVASVYRIGAVVTFSSNQSNLLVTPTVRPTPTMAMRIGGLMVVAGNARYQYGDGASRGWFWNGEVNNSTSTGPSSVL